MKSKILTLTLALMAILTFSACSSDDDDFTVTTADLVGSWTETYADKQISSDSFSLFTFNADGTCKIDTRHDQSADIEQTEFIGTWQLSDGRTLNIQAISGETESRLVFNIQSYSPSQFKAKTLNNQTVIFKRVKQ